MAPEDLRFFNPFADTQESKNRLPHWQQQGAVYFVTFRLADSIPAHLLAGWKVDRTVWLEHHPTPWSEEIEKEYHQRFSGSLERWLDAGHGACLLRKEDVRQLLVKTLQHFDEVRCHLISWVIMPNHVHLLLVVRPGWSLQQLLHSWKRHSARAIHLLLGQSGRLWQKDYFDRLVRDGAHFENCIRYIRRNPSKAALREEEHALYEDALASSVP